MRVVDRCRACRVRAIGATRCRRPRERPTPTPPSTRASRAASSPWAARAAATTPIRARSAHFWRSGSASRLIPTNEAAAGGMIAMNRTINAAPDGLTLLLTGGEGLVTAQLYGLSGVNYDVRKQVFLARVSGEDKVAVVGPPSPYQDASPTCRGSTGRRCGRAPARPTTIPISPPSCATRSASSARSSSATRAPAT